VRFTPLLAVLLAAAGLGACTGPEFAEPSPPARAWPGLARGVTGKDDLQRFARADFEALRELGARDFAYVPFGVLRDPNRPELLFRPPEERDGELVRAAHASGLRVLLKPHLWIDRSWHGEVRMTNDADWRAFFEGYADFLAAWARFATAHGVEALCIGTELDGTLGREREWRAGIAELRALYPGRLLYAAHWRHVEDVPFQDALDAIGVTAYYPLAADEDTLDSIVAAWEPIRAELRGLARRHDRPVVFAELGYRPVRGALAEPWEHAARGTFDPLVQARALEAALEVFEGEPWFGGMYLWEWQSLLFRASWQGPPRQSTGYSPQGLAGEGVLRQRWGTAGLRRSGRRRGRSVLPRAFPPRPAGRVPLAATQGWEAHQVVQEWAVAAERKTVDLPLQLPFDANRALPAWLEQELEQALAGKLDLPVLPDTAARVLALCRDERSDLRELAQLVQRDQTLAAHVLRVSNSVAYAPKQPIVSLQQALGRLGLSTVSDIAIAVAMKQRVFQVPGHEARMRELWRHSALAAGYALEVARLVGRNPETAFLAGLLHDVGMPIVLATALEACKRKKVLPATRGELEQAMLAFHCRYGAELARRWSLGSWVEAAIADHHDPARARVLREEVTVVAVADLLAEWAAEPEEGDAPGPERFVGLPLEEDQRQSLVESRARVLDLASAFQ